jgi:hypothetical protein
MCWFLTTTLDLAHPETRGKRPPGLKALLWSIQNMVDLTSLDVKSCQAFYDVLHMRKGMEGLLQPGFTAALMAYNVKSLLVPREKRANLTTLPPPPGRKDRPASPGKQDAAA